MTEKAYAYDPIRGTDVEITCRNRHQSTRYDDIDGDELPVLIDSDFKHDPVEACQGSYSEIREIPEDDGCPNCGYDRMTVSVQTLAGVHREKCRACGVDITERNRDDWSPSRPPSARERIRQNAEYIGSTRRDGVKLWKRNENGLLVWSQHDDRTQFHVRRKDTWNLISMMISTYDEDLGDDEDAALRTVQRIARLFPSDDEDTEENDD